MREKLKVLLKIINRITTSLKRIVLFLSRHKDQVDIISKIATIAGVAFVLVTLWYNFLKPASPEIKLTNTALVIWYDSSINSPAIDIFCTFLNRGGNSMLVNQVEVDITKQASELTGNTTLVDYLFLKYDPRLGWVQDVYSHPIYIDKYSEKSEMISFKKQKKDTEEFIFEEGQYSLTVKAKIDNKLKTARLNFSITKDDADKIDQKKKNKKNEATEIYLK